MLFLALCFAGFPACDGGDDGDGSGSGSVDLGENSKVASSLTPVENKELCEKIEAELGPALEELLCLTAGQMAKMMGGDTAACQAAVDGCMSADEESTSECKEEESEDCSATIGEIEACIADTKKLLEDSLDDMACSKTLDASSATEGADASPASCKVIEEKCPAMSPDTSGE